MGGRGSAARQGGGGGSDVSVKSSESLISARNEGKRTEVDQVLTVLRDVEREFGVTIGDATIDKLGRGDRTVLAYMERGTGNLGFNQRFFNEAKATQAYDDCVKSGFHPGRGDKSAIEAIAAHEMGHRINYMAAEKMGESMDAYADRIVNQAAYMLGMDARALKASISGYAKKNSAETIAEAYADVYCNGNNASESSKSVVLGLRMTFGNATYDPQAARRRGLA